MDGFVTAGEVLILNSGAIERMAQVCTPGSVPWADGPTVLDSTMMFAFSHHKSAARVATLHVICSLFLDDEVDMKAVHPVLWHSICNIRAINLSFPTMRAQTFVQHYPVPHCVLNCDLNCAFNCSLFCGLIGCRFRFEVWLGGLCFWVWLGSVSS